LEISPENQYLLAGSADGNAYIWDTQQADACFRVPVKAQLEVSKTVWINKTIGCISDDLTMSLFRQNQAENSEEENHNGGIRLVEGGQKNYEEPTIMLEESLLLQPLPKSNMCTPTKKRPASEAILTSPITTPTSNRTILDFFPKTPRH